MSDDAAKDAKRSEPEDVGRRRFLKSLFGLGTAVGEATKASAKGPKASIFWANLRNGQIGFPTGTAVPAGCPGSVMKLVTAAALKESGFFQGDETIECRGKTTINGQTFTCLAPHGNVDLTRAIGLSCNVFFTTAAQKLGAATIIDFARRLGLDSPADGIAGKSFPTAPRYEAALYAIGLAKDLEPNALQLMRLAALVACHGEPPLLHNAGEEKPADEPFTAKLNNATWATLAQGMRIALREGTGKKLDPKDDLKLAIKTGTVPHGLNFESWLIGFFPYDAPRYVFCLRSPSGTSQDQCVPEARAFLFSSTWP